MSYQSPIEVFQTQMQSQIVGEIYKAVMKVGVNVDKDELLKALQYDRNQYQKGYADRDSEIVRCNECAYAIYKEGLLKHEHIVCTKPFTEHWQVVKPDDWYCADGERRDAD